MTAPVGDNPRLRDIVSEAVEQTPDIEEAFEAVNKRLDKEPSLRDAIMRAEFEKRIRDEIYDVRHSRLRTVKRPGTESRAASGALESVATAAARSLLDRWTLPNGKLLGDTTAEELPPIVSHEREQAAGHQKNAMFLDAVCRKLKKEQRVRDGMSDTEARALWERIAEQVKAKRA